MCQELIRLEDPYRIGNYAKELNKRNLYLMLMMLAEERMQISDSNCKHEEQHTKYKRFHF